MRTPEEAYEYGFNDELEKLAKINPQRLLYKSRGILNRLKGFVKRPFVGKAPPLDAKRFVRMGVKGELTPSRMKAYGSAMRSTAAADSRSFAKLQYAEMPEFLRRGFRPPT